MILTEEFIEYDHYSRGTKNLCVSDRVVVKCKDR